MFKVRGYSLIEVMMVLLISLLILQLLFSLYLSATKSHDLQYTLRRLIQKQERVKSIFQNQLEKSGQRGCAPIYSANLDPSLSGSANELWIRYVDWQGVTLLENSTNSQRLLASKEVIFKADDELVISDCTHIETFHVKNIFLTHDQQIIIPTENLKNNFNKHAEIGQLQINHFYLKNNNLMLEEVQHENKTILTGIDNLNFKYYLKENEKVNPVPVATTSNNTSVAALVIEMTMTISSITKTNHFFIPVKNRSESHA